LSRKAEDRIKGSKDKRAKHRERTLLEPTRFDKAVLQDLLNKANQDSGDLRAASIDLILPDTDKPIDTLINEAYERSEIAQTMVSTLRDGSRRWPKHIRKFLKIAITDCKLVENKIYRRDRLFLPPDDELKTQILYRTHSTGPAGHPGRTRTLELLTRTYWWPRMSYDVAEYVKACAMCFRVKPSRSSPQGYLQPLPVPYRAWSDISVDYISPLPVCERYNVKYKHLLVVVCRLTKMRHFMPVPSLSAEDLVNAFVGRIYSLHGCPDNIVSDRGTQFVSEFWNQLSSRLGIALRPSSAFHPESDGQTERLNAEIEIYLRAFMSFHQDDWVDWLPVAEFAANNGISETTGMSPFFANYGFHPRLGVEPSTPVPPNLSLARRQQFYKANAVAARFERILDQLKGLAKESIMRYEEYANNHREDAPKYEVGDMVYVNTKNMKTNRPMKKGDDKWDGPYEVTETFRRSCRLALPENVKIYPVFHNSLLRSKPNAKGLVGQDAINTAETRNVRGRVLEREDGETEPTEKWEFVDLLDVHNEDGYHYLVKWRHQPATWQPAADLKGQDEAIMRFHAAYPEKPGPPSWVKRKSIPRNESLSKETTSNEAPVKRKPGRPRREDTLTTTPATDGTTKRGRGRPPKNSPKSILATSNAIRLRQLKVPQKVTFASLQHVQLIN
jgi:hypothetical protein